jgi:aliphatic nitrilase
MVIADLDMSLIVKRKRMMDSVGHYARPELINVTLDARPAKPLNFKPSPPVERSLADGETHESADGTSDQRVTNLWRAAG